MFQRIILLVGAVGSLVFAGSSERIRVNQVGYAIGVSKLAVSRDSTSYGSVVDSATGEVVFSAKLTNAVRWAAGADTCRVFDFTALDREGTYFIRIGGEESWPVHVARDPYLALSRGSIKAFWHQRSSYQTRSPWAGPWARAEGHPDTAAVIHSSAATATRPAGTKIRSPGGWYDAGDYGKYVVNSGISTWTLLNLYETAPGFFDTLSLDVPAHGGLRSDLVDEILWNLRWMLSMQDPEDGGVYHKLTTAKFSGFVAPSADVAVRYVIRKSTAASLDLAATAAYAARLFRDSANLSGFADSCRTAALAAWGWARTHPDSTYDQTAMNAVYTPSIATGDYGDGTMADEFIWAASELFLTTGSDSFAVSQDLAGKLAAANWAAPSWNDVGTLGWMSLWQNKSSLSGSLAGLGSLLDTNLVKKARALRDSRISSGYRAPAPNYSWGGNSVMANNGILLFKAWQTNGDTSLSNASKDALEYLLGRNATGYSFVTGFGSKPPMNPHHRPSAGDTVVAPVPGFLVGGPNSTAAGSDKCADYPSVLSGATTVLGPKEYVDEQACYASNEVAINWNAPLAWLAGAWAARREAIPLSAAPRTRAVGSALTVRLHGRSIDVALSGRNLSMVELVAADGSLIASIRPEGTSARVTAPRPGLAIVRATALDGTSATARVLVP